jgi:hypothetical protein
MPVCRVEVVTALKALSLESMDLDDMIALKSLASGISITYENYKLGTPEWLANAIDALDKDIKSKRRDHLLKQRQLLKSKQERLLSREDQKKKTDDELASIEEALKE